MIEHKKNGTQVFIGQNYRFVNAELEEGKSLASVLDAEVENQ